MAAGGSSWPARLKALDAYPKTIEEFKVRTLQGGLFSLLAFACMALLLASELRFYVATDTADKMTVDGARHSAVAIHFDVEFPRMACSVVALESADMAGNVQHDIQHNIRKTPLDHLGQPLAEGAHDVMGGALTNHTELHGETDK
ncbi:unnamed protein product [Phytophthora fragariaefolia]|uniref:Unnamed protein product n=1 Tax=Phytophthora fragariaefolia TaxID=1490495 RepID=A0A9W6XD70_9STRA|nr:unnamed protein product [Phytophthora fragariaefolia]